MLLPAEKTDKATSVKWLIGSKDRVNCVYEVGGSGDEALSLHCLSVWCNATTIAKNIHGLLIVSLCRPSISLNMFNYDSL